MVIIIPFYMIFCRRKNKPKSNALPVVRTPSKTLERPLGEHFKIHDKIHDQMHYKIYEDGNDDDESVIGVFYS